MSQSSESSTSLLNLIAEFTTQALLYIPYGFMKPIARNWDQLRDCLNHQNLPCYYCYDEKIKTSVKSRIEANLDKLHHRISCAINQQILAVLLLFFNHVEFKKSSKLCRRFGAWLFENCETIIWYGLMPFLFLSASVFCWGIQIVPELYLFLTVYFCWGNVVIDPLTNLLARGKNSAEWNFFINLGRFLKRQKCDPSFYSNCHQIWYLFKRLIFELTLFGLMGKVTHFVQNCVGNFIYWTGGYVAIKIAADLSPSRIVALERRMERTKEAKQDYFYENMLWLISYFEFQQYSGQKAKVEYQKLHQKQHCLLKHPVTERACKVNKIT